MATYPVKDFNGGLTDFPVDARPDQFEKADNLVVNEYGDLEARPGLYYDFTTDGKRCRVDNQERVGMLAPQRVGADSVFTLLKQAADKLFYDDTTDMQELQGPGSTVAFDSATSLLSFASAEWNEHTIITHEGTPWQIPVKVYRDNTGALQLRTCGLPRGDFSATTATGGSGANYVYAFVYKYTYNVGDTQYIDRGRPFLKNYTNIGTATASSAPGISIASMDTLANATGEHYDTAVVEVDIYRTVNNGTTLYYVDSVTNGTTIYTDNDSDDTLLAEGVTLYTTGGVLGNDRPPKCKYVHGTSDFVYYAHGFEVGVDGSDSTFYQNRLWQSKRGDPDSVPAGNFVDIEEPITGINSIRSIPIVFGRNSIYRLDGNYDSFGRGGIVPRKISDGIGCVGHLSIVQTNDLLFFAGNDGFYATDGYKIYPLSTYDFRDTYAGLVDTDLQRKRMVGSYSSQQQRVYWAAQEADKFPDNDNNVVFVMNTRSQKFTKFTSGYDSSGPRAELDVTVSGGTTATVTSTDSLAVGDFVFIDFRKDVYIESIDSATMFTLSSAVTNGAYLSVDFFTNTPDSIDYYSNFQPSFLLFDNDILWQADSRGFTLYYDPNIVTDVVVDGGIDGAAGATEVVPNRVGQIPRYSGAILSLGSTDYRKWVNGIVLKCRPRADIDTVLAIAPFGENDDNDNRNAMKPVFSASFYKWGTPLLQYGDPRLYRRRQQIVDLKRRFPSPGLRCDYKQLHLDGDFTNINNSDNIGTATIASGSGITKTLAIAGNLPTNLYNHWVSFEVDGYIANYKIIIRDTANQLTFIDPTGAVNTGTEIKWVIRAYPDNAFFNLIEYSFFFTPLGPSQEPFTSSDGGNV